MSPSFLTLRDLDVRDKRVLLRDDLNVPINNGKLVDDTRLTAALPTINYLREQNAKVIILSHFGRPQGKHDSQYTLEPVAGFLSERLGVPVGFALDCIGAPAREAVSNMKPGDVVLLQNVRYHIEEEKNNPSFAKALASLGDVYVNDAFGAAHRSHASVDAITQYLPSAAGLLMEAELNSLERLTRSIEHPYVCAIGGSKVRDKLRVFESLMSKVDAFVIGGGMANTFLAAQGVAIGRSIRDAELEPTEDILALAKEQNVTLYIPTDAIASPTFNEDASAAPTELADLGERMILDIGPKTAQTYAEVLRKAKTIIFNGPMGVYERTPYREGTKIVCQAIAEATKNGAVSVVGGGDAAAAAKMLGYGDAFTHISTGGGAMLEYLEGATLPGVAALEAAAAATAAK